MTEKRKYKDPRTAKKDPLHTGVAWEAMGQGVGVLKIPGLRSKRKKNNGPS